MQKYKVLVIEDEEGIREGLVEILSSQFEVSTASNGIEGLKKTFKATPDLILLDLKMAEMDGFQVCKAIREDKDFDRIPILILTAFNNVADRTKLFKLGADDYIIKPFDPSELVARIQRALNRISPEVIVYKTSISSSPLIRLGSLTIDSQSQKASIGKDVITLSTIEFKILYLLGLNFNQIVEREKILEYVWEKQNVSARLIDPHILAIREKLNGHNFSIQAIYGKGYIFKNL